jgi:DeoR/GlpR family transcriptional regulator of sugar metabolism
VGGTFRRRTSSFADPNTVEALRGYYADKAFISCPKLSPEFGLSDNHISEANVRKQMLHNAQKKVLVVDHTKLEGNANILFEGLEEIDLVITDQHLPADFEAYAAERKIEVRYCQE